MTTTTVQRLTNAAVADRLGMTESGVSRMRSGQRVASLAVMLRIATEFDGDIATLAKAAAEAGDGDSRAWINLLESLFVAPVESVA